MPEFNKHFNTICRSHLLFLDIPSKTVQSKRSMSSLFGESGMMANPICSLMQKSIPYSQERKALFYQHQKWSTLAGTDWYVGLIPPRKGRLWIPLVLKNSGQTGKNLQIYVSFQLHLTFKLFFFFFNTKLETLNNFQCNKG